MKTTESHLFTRADYMAKRCTHRVYFAQFVTPYVLGLVAARIGVDTLRASKDPHFNDIPLAKWDSFWVRSDSRGMWIEPPASVAALLKQAGEDRSASTGTCILKEAARQLVEGAPTI